MKLNCTLLTSRIWWGGIFVVKIKVIQFDGGKEFLSLQPLLMIYGLYIESPIHIAHLKMVLWRLEFEE